MWPRILWNVLKVLQIRVLGCEILCLDDCSTDDPIEIIKDISNKYESVTVLKNDQNRGVSYTCNVGRALQCYYSMKEMYRVYMQYYSSDSIVNDSEIHEKIEHMRQNLALTLVGVNDTHMVRAELRKLKQLKIYPYSRNFLQKSVSGRILNFLLQKQWGFWILHLTARLKLLLTSS
ncbi:MAG: glycosyltransferase [Muribaculaceae bacterium]|nr:glycosyltransferase [Muribaculaceae bacterium]